MTVKKPEWMQDKVKAKFINLASPGDDIFVSCNGESFLIQDGATVTVPRAVINVLKDAKKYDYTIEGDMEKGRTTRKIEKPQYMSIEIDEKTEDLQTEKDKKKQDLVRKLNKGSR